MPGKTLYLHIGLHKTGSSAVQTFCHANRDALACDHNLFYPVGVPAGFGREAEYKSPMYSVQNSHHSLFFPGSMETYTWENVARQIACHPEADVLLSAENVLHGHPFTGDPDHFSRFQYYIQKINSFLPEFQLKVILYLRREDDYLASLFNQTVKDIRASSSFDEFYESHRQSFFKYYYLPPHVLRLMKDMLGPGNFLIRLYDRTRFKNGDIVNDFFDILGRDVSGMSRDGCFGNERIPDTTLPYLTELYSSLHSLDGGETGGIKRSVIRSFTAERLSSPHPHIDSAIAADIDAMDAVVPGYKDLFARRPVCCAFPEEVDADPKDLLFFNLMLTLHEEQRRLLTQQQEALARWHSALMDNQLLLSLSSASVAVPQTFQTPWNRGGAWNATGTGRLALARTNTGRLCFTPPPPPETGRDRPVFGLALQNAERFLLEATLSALGFQDSGVMALDDSFQDYRGRTLEDRLAYKGIPKHLMAYDVQVELMLPGQFLLGMLDSETTMRIHPEGRVLLIVRDLRRIVASYLRFQEMRGGRDADALVLTADMITAFLQAPPGERIRRYAGEWVELLDHALVVRFEEIQSGNRAAMGGSLASLSLATGCPVEDVYDAVTRAWTNPLVTLSGADHVFDLSDCWNGSAKMCFAAMGFEELNRKLGYGE